MVNTAILSVVISKLDYRQELGLIVLFSIDKNLQIDYYCAILTFCLYISLRVKSR